MRLTRKNFIFTTLTLGISLCLVFTYVYARQDKTSKQITQIAQDTPTPSPTPQLTITPTTTPIITPTLTPSPTLSPAEWNQKFGPCASVPVLMYHHIQPEDLAKTKGQTALTVTPTFLASQIKYLQEHNYHIIPIQTLIDFFNTGAQLPSKSIVLTFDDGYQDFYDYAYPVLKTDNAPAVLFVPTGLMENNDYLSWHEITDMNQSGIVYMGNHTWSHHSTATSADIVNREITTAQQQLSDRGMDQLKVFAYPYGSDSKVAEKYLSDNKYQLAFTTKPGRLQCKQLRFSLPRIRIGNAQLSAYGL